MLVEFLGHAGICITAGATKLPMDAWFSRDGAFDAAWFQLPANHHLGDRDWSESSGAVVSHEHMDHLDPGFLRSLPEAAQIYVVAFSSPVLRQKIQSATGRRPVVLKTGAEHRIGEIELRVWTEESPMNQDSVWVFRHGGTSIVHMVDSRLTPAQLDEILAYLGGPPDLLLVQGSGASWYPFAYENYDDTARTFVSLRKREQKAAHALSVLNHLGAKTVVICAGPAVFLDPELRAANLDASFSLPSEARAWCKAHGYTGRIEVPLPGDRFDLRTGELTEDAVMHAGFSWDRVPEYTSRYALEMQPRIDEAYARADAIRTEDLYAAFKVHFERVLLLSPYFNQRINMTVCFDIEGEEGGRWLVDISPNGGVRRGDATSTYQYRYRFHARWLKRLLVDLVPWEDFLLSLRFAAHRDPDVYNDHLLGLLKFKDAASLRAVEQYENRISTERIMRTTSDGTEYEISKFCPHAGASLETAPLEGHILTCLNHHYVFDLATGKCLTGNCVLHSRRLPSRTW